jgi:hypothetical protein
MCNNIAKRVLDNNIYSWSKQFDYKAEEEETKLQTNSMKRKEYIGNLLAEAILFQILMKKPEEGLLTWNEMFYKRLTNIHELSGKLLGE